MHPERKGAVGARAPRAFGGRGFKWRAPSGICRMGVRRSELVREYAEDQALEWEDVDWQKLLITVPEHVEAHAEHTVLSEVRKW
jgi:hypothetical protein